MQLGSSRVSYMDIRVSFSHSAFPEFSSSEVMTGVSSTRTRMDTMATASLKRHNTLSPWSPPPAPAPNPLFQLIERHWGVEKATGAMQQMLAQRSTPRKAAKAASRLSLDSQARAETNSITVVTAPPQVPMRQASLQRAPPVTEPESTKEMPAQQKRRPLAEIPTPPSARTCKTAYSPELGGKESRSILSRPEALRRENDENAQMRKRRSLGAEALRSLVPMLAEFSDSRDRDEGRSLRGATVRARGKRDSGKRDSAIWNWGNWF